MLNWETEIHLLQDVLHFYWKTQYTGNIFAKWGGDQTFSLAYRCQSLACGPNLAPECRSIWPVRLLELVAIVINKYQRWAETLSKSDISLHAHKAFGQIKDDHLFRS